PEDDWPLDVREQALGAFQQYLRMMCMFSFWHQTYDKLAPALSNANYHPKNNVVETAVFGTLGYGRWLSCQDTIYEALNWSKKTYELQIAVGGNLKSKKYIQKTSSSLVMKPTAAHQPTSLPLGPRNST
ncbi:MAG: hypothetical protein LBU64_07345, partial [Planctomycetota bacterium]|nr:hypothetical protein [Planctomycetota bacterium]